MSVTLDPVDLSAAIVGTSQKLDWTGKLDPGQPTGPQAGKATLRLFNESNVGLQLNLTGMKSDILPAGGWGEMELSGQMSLQWTALYVIGGLSPNTLLGVIYEPGEKKPPMPVLGNSAINIGGVVNTNSSSALKNDGNGPGLEIIESTPSDQVASSLGINNDGSGFWKVLSAGVLRIVLSITRGNASSLKAVIQIGDTGDPTITTMYGNLDKLRADGGALLSDGSGNLTALGNITWNIGSPILKTLQSGAQNGITFETWTGTANLVPFSVGGQFNSALAFIDVAGALHVAKAFGAGGIFTIGDKLSLDGGDITSDGAGNMGISGNLTLTGNLDLGGNILSTAGGILIETQQSGSANGIEFETWTGSASVVPFSVGGQIGSALAWFDINGNLKLHNTISGQSGTLALVSQQSGSVNGIEFESWTGSAAVVALSVGGQFGSALSWFDTLGSLHLTGQAATYGLITSLQSGASATGLVFQAWSGSAAVEAFSIGGQFDSALAWIDINGNLAGGKFMGLPTNRSGTATTAEIYTGTGTPSGDGVTTPRTGALWAKG